MSASTLSPSVTCAQGTQVRGRGFILRLNCPCPGAPLMFWESRRDQWLLIGTQVGMGYDCLMDKIDLFGV